MTKRPGELANMTEDAILEALTQKVRASMLEEGIPERIKRRGWAHVAVYVTVQDWEVKYANVGINVQHREAS